MRRVRFRQLRLPFQGDTGPMVFPEPVRSRCRELLSQMLIAIPMADLQNQEKPDEREDPAHPP
jgi:hypothetical protein